MLQHPQGEFAQQAEAKLNVAIKLGEAVEPKSGPYCAPMRPSVPPEVSAGLIDTEAAVSDVPS